ncbi:hypothetical protein PTSG_00037 [Salpingoeca rosetta]|uniref:Zinc finger CCCH-type with G patch domain-containing protein n=1 Tax=Salpingoeca rosetta (strain ATCC 50818 / BSB-021) TaxID=946362 RepID=F2TVC5_SALR5|nr:uncharacterized protein PTSG_00037 [Salpingoeca rosetta]EGD72021.1 hypothetical protein PTSG_00037 [Salpingoeca rosetta]|eukprot:XP_004998593.1 hypothetical protein PTSG_00037 [Salpingoeca rosetta]
MSSSGVPPGWRVRASRSMPGRFYYVNVKTGETSWTRPDDTTSALARKQAEAKRQERQRRREQVIVTLQAQEDKALKELKQLQEQLASVDSLLHLNPKDEEVLTLRKNLHELMDLHQSELLQVKKERLKLQYGSSSKEAAASAGAAGQSSSSTSSSSSSAATGAATKNGDGPIVVRSSSSLMDRAEGGATLQAGMPIVPETRCQAPFSTAYGIFAYHDAIIHDVDDDGQHCTVLFVTPLYESMLPCRDYLKGRCTRGDTCVHSHGHRVAVSDLRPAAKVDFTSLTLGSLCLYRLEHERLWHYGTLVAVSDETNVVVRPHFGGQLEEVSLKQVRPVPGLDANAMDDDDGDDDGDDDESDSDTEKPKAGDDVGALGDGGDEDGPGRRERAGAPAHRRAKGRHEAASTNNSRSAVASVAKPRAVGTRMPEEEGDFAPIVMDAADADFGSWEQYSKGIGSKILAKFGYKHGQGLGSDAQGRVNPVPVQVLPQGKSLDYIMNRRLNIQIASERRKAKPSVFDFLNTALNQRLSAQQQEQERQRLEESKAAGSTTPATQTGAKPAQRKPLNVQIMDLYNEIEARERVIARYRPSLQRQHGELRRRAQETLSAMEGELEDLKRKKAKLEKTTDSKRKLKKFVRF